MLELRFVFSRFTLKIGEHWGVICKPSKIIAG